MIFDKETEALEYENQGSRLYYARMQKQQRRLTDVFDSCDFSDGQARVETEEKVRALQLNEERIEIECKKFNFDDAANDSDEELWHRIQFIPSRNPFTGRFSIVVYLPTPTYSAYSLSCFVCAFAAQKIFSNGLDPQTAARDGDN